MLEPLILQLRELADKGAVSTWSNDQVRVYSHRPWVGDGVRGELQHVARLHIEAEFTDFERLSGFVDYWAGTRRHRDRRHRLGRHAAQPPRL